MADGESFLRRWSRLKQEGGREDAAPCPPPEEATAPPVEHPEPPDLPPLDSLGADSDYTAFLAEGVPAELKRLALRKAWASDPAIADFRGFAEYDWDYNAPGYGQLLPTDDVLRMVEDLFGRPEQPVVEVAENAPTEGAPSDGLEHPAESAPMSKEGPDKGPESV